jgi:hypothetical protein
VHLRLELAAKNDQNALREQLRLELAANATCMNQIALLLQVRALKPPANTLAKSRPLIPQTILQSILKPLPVHLRLELAANAPRMNQAAILLQVRVLKPPANTAH